MSHAIGFHSLKAKYIALNLFLGNVIYVGMKRFMIFDGKIRPPVQTSKKYRWKKSVYGLEAKPVKVFQIISFKFPIQTMYQDQSGYFSQFGVHEQFLETKTSVYAGYHISPILVSGSYSLFIPLDDQRIIQVPVLFEKRDILFFDGYDVSVKKFFLPSLDLLKKLMEAMSTMTGQDYRYSMNFSYYKILYENAISNFDDSVKAWKDE